MKNKSLNAPKSWHSGISCFAAIVYTLVTHIKQNTWLKLGLSPAKTGLYIFHLYSTGMFVYKAHAPPYHFNLILCNLLI